MGRQFKNHVKYWQNNQRITVAILKFLAEQGLELCALTEFCSLLCLLIVISQSDFHQEVKYNSSHVASLLLVYNSLAKHQGPDLLKTDTVSSC